MTGEGQQASRLAYIDALRGIAILLVIAVHTSSRVSESQTAIAELGQLGVQLFFVVSAYTLCMSSHARGDQEPWRFFYIRRFFRIAPMFYVGLVLYYLVAEARLYAAGRGFLLFPTDGYGPLAIASNLTLTHGFVPVANNNTVPGGWSIGTEVAFYALFPVLFLWARRMHGTHGVAGVASLVVASLLLNAAVQVAIWWFTGYTLANNSFLYFNLVNQLPVFAIGILLYFAVADEKWLPGLVGSVAILVASACACIFLWTLQSRVPGVFALIPTVSAIGFAALLTVTRTGCANFRWLILVGKTSYSIYLLHFVCISILARALLPYIRWMPSLPRHLAFWAAAALVTLAVAMVTERYVERSGIEAGRRLIRLLRRPAMANAISR
jgi:peptidoglycan/LPS O-acetylase OafA/YrhL